MLAQQASVVFEDPRGFLITSITVIERETLAASSVHERLEAWAGIHASTLSRLVNAIARYAYEHGDVTFHQEPAQTILAWNGDARAVAYRLAMRALKHEDLSHMLARDERAPHTIPVRFHTKCGCESSTMFLKEPLPETITKPIPLGAARTFKRGAYTVFGTLLYCEV